MGHCKCSCFFLMTMTRDFNENTFAELLRAEQLDLLNRMDVPVGIARNKAILENVFVTLVCMLNHIPVFVIGKPGSGKTLALQLIYGFVSSPLCVLSDSQDFFVCIYEVSLQGFLLMDTAIILLTLKLFLGDCRVCLNL